MPSVLFFYSLFSASSGCRRRWKKRKSSRVSPKIKSSNHRRTKDTRKMQTRLAIDAFERSFESLYFLKVRFTINVPIRTGGCVTEENRSEGFSREGRGFSRVERLTRLIFEWTGGCGDRGIVLLDGNIKRRNVTIFNTIIRYHN